MLSSAFVAILSIRVWRQIQVSIINNMVKVYRPPSQRFSSSEELVKVVNEEKPIVTPLNIFGKRDVCHVQARDRGNHAAYLNPLPPTTTSSKDAAAEDSNKQAIKVICNLPPSMRRQQLVQKSRKWGFVPPSLIRQSRGDRQINGQRTDIENELREDSANVNWLFTARQTSKESSSIHHEELPIFATPSPPWFARLIGVQTCRDVHDNAASTALTTTDKKKVDVSESLSSWFSKLNVGSESDIFAFSMPQQLMDSGNSFWEQSFASTSSPESPPNDSLQVTQQKANFSALSTWLSHQKDKIVVELPPLNDPFQQLERTDKVRRVPWLKTWIESRSLAKSLKLGNMKSVDDSGNAAAPQSKTVNEFCKEENRGSLASDASDIAKRWLSKWAALGVQRQLSNVDTVDTIDQEIFVPDSLPPALAKTLFPNENRLDTDPLSWVDRVLLSVECVLPITENESYEPMDDDCDDGDVEPEDDDDDDGDNYFSYRLKEDYHIKPILQDQVKKQPAVGRDDPSSVSTKTVKRVRFNLHDDEA